VAEEFSREVCYDIANIKSNRGDCGRSFDGHIVVYHRIRFGLCFRRIFSFLDTVGRRALRVMWQNCIFGMHWKHQGKMYYDELSAESQDDAAGYFIDHMGDDVSLMRVDLVRPDDGGVRELPNRPFRLSRRGKLGVGWMRMRMPSEIIPG
jgi:hypothetical protein